VRIHDELQKCLTLEGKAHQLFDDSCSNLAYGNLSAERREFYMQQTYEATRLHAESQAILRALAVELNKVLGTGYHLD
jgi:hypothetical protein